MRYLGNGLELDDALWIYVPVARTGTQPCAGRRVGAAAKHLYQCLFYREMEGSIPDRPRALLIAYLDRYLIYSRRGHALRRRSRHPCGVPLWCPSAL